jgi:hypothetical protein
MSRDLAASEKEAFQKLYGAGAKCRNCGNPDTIIRIWEKYGSGANKVGGDISPSGIVAAVVVCERCGHGQVLSRPELQKAASVAA